MGRGPVVWHQACSPFEDAVQVLVLLVWLGVVSSLVLFCWELAWKLRAVCAFPVCS